jgi:nitrate/nitrite transporter NarK
MVIVFSPPAGLAGAAGGFASAAGFVSAGFAASVALLSAGLAGGAGALGAQATPSARPVLVRALKARKHRRGIRRRTGRRSSRRSTGDSMSAFIEDQRHGHADVRGDRAVARRLVTVMIPSHRRPPVAPICCAARMAG